MSWYGIFPSLLVDEPFDLPRKFKHVLSLQRRCMWPALIIVGDKVVAWAGERQKLRVRSLKEIERELEELYYVHAQSRASLGYNPFAIGNNAGPSGHWLLDCEIDAVYEEGLTIESQGPSRVGQGP